MQDRDATEPKLGTGSGNGDLSCMGTGMDVACSYDENGVPKAVQISPETLKAAAGVARLILAALFTCTAKHCQRMKAYSVVLGSNSKPDHPAMWCSTKFGCLSDPQKQPACATAYALFVPKEACSCAVQTWTKQL